MSSRLHAVFFDLETSDSQPIGQILNYAFVAVDEDYEPLRECCGSVAISRLQLPRAGAILANRVNVLEYRAAELRPEAQSMREIVAFIEGCITERGGVLPIVGYNSVKFDIPFLRTSLIRNGLSPYFNGKIVSKDLFLLCRKLALREKSFPRVAGKVRVSEGEPPRRSLSLEALCTSFGLLTGVQLHEARADVLLTISLAKTLLQRYRADITQFQAYELDEDHVQMGRGEVSLVAEPTYELETTELEQPIPMTLLDADHRSALWIDLNQFAAGKGERSIRYLNIKNGMALFRSNHGAPTAEQRALAKAARDTLRAVNLKTYFSKSTCDIEQDIYRLDFDCIDALHAAIWRGEREQLASLKNRDADIIFARWRLANVGLDGRTLSTAEEGSLKNQLRQYAEYRYGGKLKMRKVDRPEDPDDGELPRFHPTAEKLISDIESRLKTELPATDRTLLEALREYYHSSPIAGAAPELFPAT